MNSLYELNQAWQELANMLYQDDVDEQAILDTLESIEGEIEDKADNYPNAATYHQMLEGSDKAAGFLKGLMTSLEASNPDFKWGWDEKKLVGLRCGAIFGEEEYEKFDGSVGTSCRVKFIRTIKSIQEGNFKVPELKKLPVKGDSYESFDYLPF